MASGTQTLFHGKIIAHCTQGMSQRNLNLTIEKNNLRTKILPGKFMTSSDF